MTADLRQLVERLSDDVLWALTEKTSVADHQYWERLRAGILSALAAALPASEPVAMLMFCPRCSRQHIDAPNGDWTNPPHATHTCQHCGLLWRPSNVNTTGVAVIECLEDKHRERIAAALPAPVAAEGNALHYEIQRKDDGKQYGRHVSFEVRAIETGMLIATCWTVGNANRVLDALSRQAWAAAAKHPSVRGKR